MKNNKKQAVVIVHGIGEQRPMETVREFVETIWAKDKSLKNTRFWSKPSEVCQSYEQRRLTTDYADIAGSGAKCKLSRIDFYEYYWAHQTVGTTFDHLKSWVFSLLFRSPVNYPKALLPIYYLVWALILISIPLLILMLWPQPNNLTPQDPSILVSLSSSLWPLLFPALAGVIISLSVAYIGDVARYVTSSPANIQVRQRVRQGGIELLESIEKTGKYERIILVGHSLGSIIAYDMLTQLWARQNKFKNEHGDSLALSDNALNILEKMESIDSVEQQSEYRALQHQLFEQLQTDSTAASCATGFKYQPWLVTDFITLGSPLTYADFLLCKTKQKFEQRKADRQFPTSPPVKENGHFHYTEKQGCFLHHGAVFAPVRWTNIYSPSSNIIFGDIVSGPIAQVFNCPVTEDKPEKSRISPILDIPVDASTPGRFPNLLTHTNYWKWHDDYEDQQKLPAHIVELRNALDLKMHR